MNRDELYLVAEALLQQHGLDTVHAADLASALSSATLKRLVDDEVLCHEGDQGNFMWVLLKGKIRVFKRDYQGRERKLATMLPPTMLGHMAVVDGTRRSATCRAVGEVLLVAVDRGRFDAMMRDTGPQGDVFRRVLITSLWQQLAKGNQRIADLMSPNHEEEPTAEQTSAALVDAVATFEGWR